VELTRDVLDQAVRYNLVLNVNLIIITNGHQTYICRKFEEGYRFIDKLPKYEEII
jgi:hypothetical protein